MSTKYGLQWTHKMMSFHEDFKTWSNRAAKDSQSYILKPEKLHY